MPVAGRVLPVPYSTTESFTWTVKNFYSQTGCADGIWSPLFSALGANWWLGIRPTFNSGDVSRTVMWLSKTPTLSNLNVRYEFGLQGRNGNEMMTCSGDSTFTSNHSDVIHGESPLLLQDLDVYIPGGILKIFCRLREGGAPCQAEETPGVQRLIQDFRNMFLNEQDTDMTLIVGDREFRVLKAVLRARSHVFAAMIEHDMREGRSCPVDITDCDPQAFRDFLLYLYTGKADDLSSSNAFHLYKVADKYDVDDLRQTCLKFIRSNLSADILGDVLNLALQHHEQDLLHQATEYFIDNLGAVIVSDSWQTFIKENSVESNELYRKALEQHGYMK